MVNESSAQVCRIKLLCRIQWEVLKSAIHYLYRNKQNSLYRALYIIPPLLDQMINCANIMLISLNASESIRRLHSIKFYYVVNYKHIVFCILHLFIVSSSSCEMNVCRLYDATECNTDFVILVICIFQNVFHSLWALMSPWSTSIKLQKKNNNKNSSNSINY